MWDSLDHRDIRAHEGQQELLEFRVYQVLLEQGHLHLLDCLEQLV